MELKTTRDKIVYNALVLFANNGYEATSVGDIADAVGIKAPSLYNHFKSKQEIFDTIIEYSRIGFNKHMMEVKNRAAALTKERILSITLEDQIKQVRKLFDVTLHREETILFRKLMTIEGYNHPELAKEYNKRYIDSHIASYSQIIKVLIDGKILKDENPVALAALYAAPLAIYIEMAFRDPAREQEAFNSLCEAIKLFNKTFRL